MTMIERMEAIEAQVAAELAPAPAEKPARKKRAKAAAVQG